MGDRLTAAFAVFTVDSIMLSRVIYRGKQFWWTLFSKPSASGLEQVRMVLTPAQQAIFFKMQSSEQAHAIAVLNKVRNQAVGEPFPEDLEVAALLHDVGKVRAPLRIWERVLIVLGNTFFPRYVRQWSSRRLSRWARPFIVAGNHPVWGAEMAAECGTPALALTLIRRHQDSLQGEPQTDEDRWLKILQQADDEN